MGDVFELHAYQDNQPVDNFTFAEPVVFEIMYSAANVAGVKEQTLQLLHWNSTTGKWESAACGDVQHQPDQNRLQVPVCGLSIFGLFGGVDSVFVPLINK